MRRAWLAPSQRLASFVGLSLEDSKRETERAIQLFCHPQTSSLSFGAITH